MRKLTLIKFDRAAGQYARAEIAGFPAERSALYVKNGIAGYCDADGQPTKVPTVVTVAPVTREDPADAFAAAVGAAVAAVMAVQAQSGQGARR